MANTQSFFKIAQIEVTHFNYAYDDRPNIQGIEIKMFDQTGEHLTTITVTGPDETRTPQLHTP